MAETYDSVLDRVGAFNAATEKLTKGKLQQIDCVATAKPECWVRLAKTDENYRFEIGAGSVPAEKETTLLELKFVREGDVWRREVRKAERSWNVASQIEDVFGEVFGFPTDTAISIEVSGGDALISDHRHPDGPHFPDIHIG